MINKILLGDLLDRLKEFPDNYFTSVVCDPPYGLKFMGVKWDYQVPSVEEWKEILRVLRPGGFLVAFGGTRTYHRMVVNIEDAGFEIRDQLAWIYSSGFPKSKNIKDQGLGTALKPAMEPIVLARKPTKFNLIDNIILYDTGFLNIDGSRIRFTNEADQQSAVYGTGIDITGGNYKGDAKKTAERKIKPNELGRWPANVILDPESAAMLDEQSGILTSGTGATMRKTAVGYTNNAYQRESRVEGTELITYGDTGGASRFFYCAKPSAQERNAGTGLNEKTLRSGSTMRDIENTDWSQTNGNDHPTVKPIKLMRYLVNLVTPFGGPILDPYAGSGTTGCACELLGFNYVLIDREKKHIPIIKERIAYWKVVGQRARRIENYKKSQLNLF